MSVDTTDEPSPAIEAMNIDKEDTNVNSNSEAMESTTDHDNDTAIEDLTATPSNGHTNANNPTDMNTTDTKHTTDAISTDIDSNKDSQQPPQEEDTPSEPTIDDDDERNNNEIETSNPLANTNANTPLINGSHDDENNRMEEDDDEEEEDVIVTSNEKVSNNNNRDNSDNNNRNGSKKAAPKVRKIGYDWDGALMPGFEDVNDDELAFSSESDFAIFIKQISSEIPLQRLVAVKRMMKSCKLWGLEAVLSVLPRVKQLSCDKEMVIRQAIAEVLGPFAKYLIETTTPSTTTNTSTIDDDDKIDIAHGVIINELLPLIKEMLMDAMEVRQGAGNSLIIIAELLNKEQVYEHILKIVLHMAHDDSDDQKITALPLLGDLAPIVGSAVCKNYLSADLHALSQDNSFRVRKATVQYFGPICSQLSSDECSECLLPIFLHLCSDSIWSVRKGCVESFVDVSCSIAPSERVQLMPIMEKFLNDSSRWVRNTAYEILGPFISTLESSQISNDLLTYFTSIPHLSSAEADADCTNHCAFNFPAVVLTVGRERWSELADTYAILCRKTFKSRKTLACSIHEIAGVLGQELTEKHLLNSIEFFLKDIDDIRCGIIRHLWKILAVFSDKLRCEYISILWELASESDVNWRFRLLLAQQLDEILYLYSQDMMRQQLIPLIFQLCQDRMADVRYAAVYPIADAINILKSGENTQGIADIADRIASIYKGRTYSKRLLYIRIADSCFGRIDDALFDDLFLNDLCAYHKDPIFNVRYCLARFIDKIKKKEEKSEKKNVKIEKVIEILRNDEQDIEIKRFFCTEEEIERWLCEKKEKEAKLELEQMMTNSVEGINGNGTTTGAITTQAQQQQQQQQQLYNNLMNDDDNNSPDSTDSSLYSSSDSGDDDSLNDDSLSEDDDDDEEEDVLGDQLQSVRQQLTQMDDNFKTQAANHANQQQDKEQSEELLLQQEIENIKAAKKEEQQQEEEEEEEQGLVHQDTPYVLNISKELQKEEENENEKKNEPQLLYGLKLDNENNENNNNNDTKDANENNNNDDNDNNNNNNNDDDASGDGVDIDANKSEELTNE